MDLETCNTDAHVPVIERTNRFVKERVRCIRLNVPFQKIPRQFTIELVRRTAVLINQIPSKKRGVHQVISPRELIKGKEFRVPACNIGKYVMGYQKTTNDSGTSRCVERLYLGPNNNGTRH